MDDADNDFIKRLLSVCPLGSQFRSKAVPIRNFIKFLVKNDGEDEKIHNKHRKSPVVGRRGEIYDLSPTVSLAHPRASHFLHIGRQQEVD